MTDNRQATDGNIQQALGHLAQLEAARYCCRSAPPEVLAPVMKMDWSEKGVECDLEELAAAKSRIDRTLEHLDGLRALVAPFWEGEAAGFANALLEDLQERAETQGELLDKEKEKITGSDELTIFTQVDKATKRVRDTAQRITDSCQSAFMIVRDAPEDDPNRPDAERAVHEAVDTMRAEVERQIREIGLAAGHLSEFQTRRCDGLLLPTRSGLDAAHGGGADNDEGDEEDDSPEEPPEDDREPEPPEDRPEPPDDGPPADDPGPGDGDDGGGDDSSSTE